MQIRTLIGGFVLGAAVGLIGAQAMSQQQQQQSGARNDSKPQQPSPQEMEQMMKAWMDAATPGEPHREMAKAVGAYDTVTRMWMDPNSPPTESKGTSEIKSVLGGRFIMQTDRSQFAMPDATGNMTMMPMEGIGLFGYDNYQKMYIGCWADSLGTQMLTMRGTLSPDGKTMTMYGEMDEPMLGIRGRMVKYVTEHRDDGSHVFTVYDLAAGDNYKVVEVTYTRKK